ncbi:MAG: DUF2203 domain-containing protein [Candidatus Heimdallarchaeota archaeon]|nr:DUF2203 domain-containing protein [Candidatus Heimdallarchaeota archaeon]
MNDKVIIHPISVKEAKERLELIIPMLEEIQEKLVEYTRIEKQFSMVDYTKYSNIRYQLDVIEEEIFFLQQDITSLDCIIKDPRIGLIDFISFRGDEKVWLCYKLGEPGLTFYHGWNEGYRGRQFIDFD